MKVSKVSMNYVICVVLGALVLYGIVYGVSRMMKTEGFESGSTFTLYYADWCPHCKTVKPAFESWMSSQTLVTAKMYEADRDADKIQAAGVKGFPTFQLTKADGSVVDCTARDPAGWNAFLKENL
jgi:thiol-disulfide isomerase/thioredoxin